MFPPTLLTFLPTICHNKFIISASPCQAKISYPYSPIVLLDLPLTDKGSQNGNLFTTASTSARNPTGNILRLSALFDVLPVRADASAVPPRPDIFH